MIFPKLHIEWERWKWNDEYGLWVSTLGNFKTDKKKDMKVRVGPKGYLAVKSYKANTFVNAHRLVMMTWKPIANADSMTVDHLDHNKRNNRLSNLEWVTEEENKRRAAEDLVDQKKKMEKIKFIPTAYTLEHFYLCCNGLYFTESAEVLTYMRTQNPCVSAHHRAGIDKAFQTLINAYNNQNPEYVAKGFMKKVHGCELSIVKKGA
jgi:hypothetical protein